MNGGTLLMEQTAALGSNLTFEDGGALESEGTLTVIPEPSTGLLLAAMLGLLALRRRRG